MDRVGDSKAFDVPNRFMPLPAWVYIALWVLYAYLFISILSFGPSGFSNLLVSGLYLIEFGVHELSHLAVFFMPAIFVAAAGSVGEISFVILMAYATFKAKSYFAACFVGLWLMLAFRSVGTYMADARAQQLPLIGPGETVKHDWNYVFTQLGWLNADTAIGGTVQIIGVIIGVLSLLYAAYLIIIKVTQD